MINPLSYRHRLCSTGYLCMFLQVCACAHFWSRAKQSRFESGEHFMKSFVSDLLSANQKTGFVLALTSVSDITYKTFYETLPTPQSAFEPRGLWHGQNKELTSCARWKTNNTTGIKTFFLPQAFSDKQVIGLKYLFQWGFFRAFSLNLPLFF